MKEILRSLKGIKVKTKQRTFLLRQIFRPNDCDEDTIFFLTDVEVVIAKIYCLLDEDSQARFNKERNNLERISIKGLALCIAVEQFEHKAVQFAALFISKMQKPPCSLLDFPSYPVQQLLKACHAVLETIIELRNQKMVFLNIRPENIVLTLDGFKLLNAEFVSNEGGYQEIAQQNRYLIEKSEEETFKFFSPQVLDQYLRLPIDYKSDVFSLGCILYQVAFGTYPFESRLANINLSYKRQDGPVDAIVSQIFKPYSLRASPQQLIGIVGQYLIVNDPPKAMPTAALPSQQKQAPGFFDFLNKFLKQTEGWYLHYVQDSQIPPDDKYLEMILNKLYQNTAKKEKLQQAIQKELNTGKRSMSIILKSAMFIFQVLRRGPTIQCPASTWAQWSHVVSLIDCPIIEGLKECITSKLELIVKLLPHFRGNFYLLDPLHLHEVTDSLLSQMIEYQSRLVACISTSIKAHQKLPSLIEWALNILCDDLYDAITVTIICVICIRKDNQIGRRKDHQPALQKLESDLKVLLKKINIVASQLHEHTIYSLETDYMSYREQLTLREAPISTSIEYFFRPGKKHKGLGLPPNHAAHYSSNLQKQFRSNESPEKKPQSAAKACPFGNWENDIDSDDNDSPQNNSSKQIIQANRKTEEILELNNIIDPTFELTRKLSGQTSNQSSSKVTASQGSSPFNPFEEFNLNPLAKSSANKPPIAKHPQKESTTTNSPFGADFASFSNFNSPGQVAPSQNSLLSPPNTPAQTQKADPFALFNFTPQKQAPKPQTAFDAFNFNFPLVNKLSETPLETQPRQKNQIAFSQSLIPGLPLLEPPKKTQQQQFVADLLNLDWPTPTNQVPKVPSPAKSIDPVLQEILSNIKLKELKQLLQKSPNFAIAHSKITFDRMIGGGSAGEVYLGQYNGIGVAIKRVKAKMNPNALKQFERQLVTYLKIKLHPCLVSLVGVSKSTEDMFLLTEFCNEGSLFDLLHKRAGIVHLNWPQKIELATQIAEGMYALHTAKPNTIIHRDLKSLNVFINRGVKGDYQAKVADFGLSRNVETEMMTMALGTLHWMAPELLDNKPYSIKVDVYSYGILLWEIAARKTPYHDLTNPMAIFKHVLAEKKRPSLKLVEPGCPEGFIALTEKCWADQPEDRPDFGEVLTKIRSIKL